jgi:hypothetical protein
LYGTFEFDAQYDHQAFISLHEWTFWVASQLPVWCEFILQQVKDTDWSSSRLYGFHGKQSRKIPPSAVYRIHVGYQEDHETQIGPSLAESDIQTDIQFHHPEAERVYTGNDSRDPGPKKRSLIPGDNIYGGTRG